jgi:PleD family two-component response regulator
MIYDDDLKSMTVWVVDDDINNLRLISAILHQSGFNRVHSLISGEEALERLKTEHPDLILLDIIMPGISGYELLEQLQKNRKTAHIPVIMITAVSLEEDMGPLRRSFELGATDYISKPYAAVELEMRVKSSLRLEKQRQDLETAVEKIRSWEKLLPICSYCKKVRSDKTIGRKWRCISRTHRYDVFPHPFAPLATRCT